MGPEMITKAYLFVMTIFMLTPGSILIGIWIANPRLTRKRTLFAGLVIQLAMLIAVLLMFDSTVSK